MSLGFTSYEVENDEKFAEALNRAAKGVKDIKVPLAQIGRDFRKSRQAIWNLKGPGQYPDLSPKYKKVKQRAFGFVYPILRATRRLEKSVTQVTHAENVTRIRTSGADFGTNTPYANYHQQEGDTPAEKMPLRKFLFIGPESVKFANSELSGFPERALNTLNSYVLRVLGNNVEQATGVKPIIKEGK